MQRNLLHVTAVHQFGPFLLICGHHNKQLVDQFNGTIQSYLPVLRHNTLITPPKSKTIYLVNNGVHSYRAVLVKQNSPTTAVVEFIDYGVEEEVPLRNVSCILIFLINCIFFSIFYSTACLTQTSVHVAVHVRWWCWPARDTRIDVTERWLTELSLLFLAHRFGYKEQRGRIFEKFGAVGWEILFGIVSFGMDRPRNR